MLTGPALRVGRGKGEADRGPSHGTGVVASRREITELPCPCHNQKARRTGMQPGAEAVASIVGEPDGFLLGCEFGDGQHGPKDFVPDLHPQYPSL